MKKTVVLLAVLLLAIALPARASSAVEEEAFWEAFDLQIESMVDPTRCGEINGDYDPEFYRAEAQPFLDLVEREQNLLSEYATFLLTEEGRLTYLDYLEVAWEEACFR